MFVITRRASCIDVRTKDHHRDDYLAQIPEEERGDMVKAYHKRLFSDDEKVRISAAKAWSRWEYVLFSSLAPVQLQGCENLANSNSVQDGYEPTRRLRAGHRSRHYG